MIGMRENGFGQRWQPSRAAQAEGSKVGLEARPEEVRLNEARLKEERLEQVTPLTPGNQQIDNLRSGREQLSPKLRRAWSAGQLLFQVVGVAGFAGYFIAMHTFLRLFSGALMAGTWYLIYRVKGSAQP
jgi:hypothetical protein